MTPAQIETAARLKLNGISSSFYSSVEIYGLIYQAELEMASETGMFEDSTVVSGGSVAGTQSYAYPTGVSQVVRAEYDGAKLEKIDFDQDDALTLLNSNTTERGVPRYFFDWEKTIYLRPIPDTSAKQIKLYYLSEPTDVTTSTQVLEAPSIFHRCIVDFVTAEMAYKDQQDSIGDRYMQRWENVHIPRMKRWAVKRKRAAGFKVVKDTENLVHTKFGVW